MLLEKLKGLLFSIGIIELFIKKLYWIGANWSLLVGAREILIMISFGSRDKREYFRYHGLINLNFSFGGSIKIIFLVLLDSLR